MMIVVAASDDQWNELTATRPHIEWQRVKHASDFIQYKNADAFFCLNTDEISTGFDSLAKPVIVNLVIQTLGDLSLPSNVFRVNGWAGFLNRTSWEIAGVANEAIEAVFTSLHIKINFVKDESGFISARVIAMIINEAYFALEDDVSSKAEIDTAMKLGTNYPLGPFEWALQIGVQNILALLQKLYLTDSRYKPSQFLIKEATENQ
ncbi:MAG: 3-hydroxyacyl-CoA dehydrogenase family protein [Ferruginibacter sp.]